MDESIGDFVVVEMAVFGAPVVVDAFVGSFNDGEYALNAVGSDVVTDVLSSIVVHVFMVVPVYES